jgi:hypothetical protein
VLAKDALKAAARTELVPLLWSHGFRGSFPIWRLQRDDDCAVVEIQAGLYNEGESGQFYLKLALVPGVWWDWTHECARLTPWGSASKAGKAREWDGLYRADLAPTGRSHDGIPWTVDGPGQAAAVAVDMAATLGVVLDATLDLLQPSALLVALESGAIDDQTPVNDRPGMPDIVRAVLLSDVGGPELDAVCQRLNSFAGHDYAELALATATWARQRSRAGPSGAN